MPRTIRDMGFGCAELSRGMRINLRRQIWTAVDAGKTVESFPHCFRPLRVGTIHATPSTKKTATQNAHQRDKASLYFLSRRCPQIKTLTGRLVGFRLHPLAFPVKNQRQPKTIGIDFATLKPMVKPHPIKGLELSSSEAVQDASWLGDNWGVA